MTTTSWVESSGFISSHVLTNATPSTIATAALVTVVLIALTTRLISNSWGPLKGKDGTWSVGVAPYWFPLLGHIPILMINPDRFLRKLRDASAHGIFAVNLGGSIHNLAHTPSLVEGIFAQRTAVETEEFSMFILNRFFGVPRSFNKRLAGLFKGLTQSISMCLMREPGLGKMLAGSVTSMNEHIPNLVSFASRPIDQSLWERASDADVWRSLKENGEADLAVEANFFPLLRNFMGHIATPLLMGQDFMDNYPEVLQDIWDLDYGLTYLIAGIPRWVPIPSLGRALRARERLNRKIADFHSAMDLAEDSKDPGSEWRDFSDISDALKDRYRLWRENKIPPRLRSDLPLLWAMNVNSNNICFWLILRILSTPGLVGRIRTEIEPHVHASQPGNVLGLAEPPRLQMSVAGLREECPLLKSCYFEALRLDSAPLTIKHIVKDFIVTEDEKDAPGNARSFALKAGEYVHIPFDVHQSDPRYFSSPELFIPERFLVRREGPGGKLEVDIGTLRPYGGGVAICKGKLFAEGEVLAFVAGIIALWDFEPVSGHGWQIPEHVRASGVTLPKSDIRVRVRRRKLEIGGG
ncbi:hypothetical protein FGG08_004815 [Glutinoglossum americanum]|uniref:Cytochrome P450 n=1 Tax=Glutinoglossum americanum TaxID=1670608 RepID=A0A9P8I8G8_9PEZI|nr:hypothetical protein FGG08_004815 [Glutinoglossum americanum]